MTRRQTKRAKRRHNNTAAPPTPQPRHMRQIALCLVLVVVLVLVQGQRRCTTGTKGIKETQQQFKVYTRTVYQTQIAAPFHPHPFVPHTHAHRR